MILSFFIIGGFSIRIFVYFFSIEASNIVCRLKKSPFQLNSGTQVHMSSVNCRWSSAKLTYSAGEGQSSKIMSACAVRHKFSSSFAPIVKEISVFAFFYYTTSFWKIVIFSVTIVFILFKINLLDFYSGLLNIKLENNF